ncbi:hypothetical protein Tco_1295341 [Tanacetum coccineum]
MGFSNTGLYKPVEAFKTDLEWSPPEAIYERCKAIPTDKDIKKEKAPLIGEFIKVDKATAEVNDDVTSLTYNGETRETGENLEEFEVNHKKLRDKLKKAKERYSSQITTLQEDLQSQQSNQKELAQVKKSFETLNNESNERFLHLHSHKNRNSLHLAHANRNANAESRPFNTAGHRVSTACEIASSINSKRRREFIAMK